MIVDIRPQPIFFRKAIYRAKIVAASARERYPGAQAPWLVSGTRPVSTLYTITAEAYARPRLPAENWSNTLLTTEFPHYRYGIPSGCSCDTNLRIGAGSGMVPSVLTAKRIVGTPPACLFAEIPYAKVFYHIRTKSVCFSTKSGLDKLTLFRVRFIRTIR